MASTQKRAPDREEAGRRLSQGTGFCGEIKAGHCQGGPLILTRSGLVQY